MVMKRRKASEKSSMLFFYVIKRKLNAIINTYWNMDVYRYTNYNYDYVLRSLLMILRDNYSSQDRVFGPSCCVNYLPPPPWVHNKLRLTEDNYKKI